MSTIFDPCRGARGEALEARESAFLTEKWSVPASSTAAPSCSRRAWICSTPAITGDPWRGTGAAWRSALPADVASLGTASAVAALPDRADSVIAFGGQVVIALYSSASGWLVDCFLSDFRVAERRVAAGRGGPLPYMPCDYVTCEPAGRVLALASGCGPNRA
ncbi:hypothetical protein TSOC_002467 [Tetrabaena socialis]|uniref:Uncharacterized protein n=1 Tax=Tetrabaena socialis TaxID=47790 RepID=A0A2J8AE10_9CHLO|nr:hypothetical protein TSOC_002467 [Tetrabaena socialis]|eukprot:PNH10750.1 hypothetical protein TSOC_002467 [Tetrabaena socialis]